MDHLQRRNLLAILLALFAYYLDATYKPVMRLSCFRYSRDTSLAYVASTGETRDQIYQDCLVGKTG